MGNEIGRGFVGAAGVKSAAFFGLLEQVIKI